MSSLKIKLLSAIFIILVFIMGWLCNGAYREISNQRFLNGLWVKGADFETAKDIAYGMDEYGDWVMVNIASDMSYPLAYETCVHECSHQVFSEIYAEKCDEDINKCILKLKS